MQLKIMQLKAFIYTLLLIGLVQLINPVEPAASIISIPLEKELSQSLDNPKQLDMIHYVNVELGTPGKGFKVKLDLKFNELFVPHYEWTKINPYLHFKTGFLCSKSISCEKLSKDYTIFYEGAQLSGNVCRDILTLHRSNNALVSFPQTFLTVKEAKKRDLSGDIVDGYFGLGPIQQGTKKQGLIKALNDAKLIELMKFSMWFNMNKLTRSGGELVLGGVDVSRYNGEISWHRMLSSDIWALNLQYVYLGEKQVSAQVGRAILSSTTSGIYGPSSMVGKIYNSFSTKEKNGIVYVDCNMIDIGPMITFIMDNIRYGMHPSNYIIKSLDNKCYLNIFPTTASDNDWILGTSFLSSYYTVFDITYGQIGFASVRPELSVV